MQQGYPFKTVSFVNISIMNMVESIVSVLKDNKPSIYLFGSYILDDYRMGVSDIDILVLTEKDIQSAQAECLVNMRQDMLKKEEGNPFYRTFEGGMLTLSSFISKQPCTTVYWGTSGQKITYSYVFDAFCMTELLKYGILLYGEEVRGMMHMPTYAELYKEVENYYETIIKYARQTGRSLYSFGWLLDISRCIYTIRSGDIIAKTEAGSRAYIERLCPVRKAIKIAINIRERPEVFVGDEATLDYSETMGPVILKYAKVLKEELDKVYIEV